MAFISSIVEMTVIVFMLFTIVTSTLVSLPPDESVALQVRSGFNVIDTIPKYGNIVHAIVTFISLCTIAALFVGRLRLLKAKGLRVLYPIRILVIMIYIGTLSFTFATNLVLSVWGFNTRNLCNVAIHVCISFYVFCKFLGYLYLVERMHQLSAGVKRRKDVVYLISMAIVLCGIGLFTGFAFVFPITNLSEIDGVCRIGLPAKITIPLLAYDVILNLGLAGIFFRRGTKIARVVGFQHFSKCVKLAMPWRTMPDPRTNPVQFTEYFMGRSLIAAFAIICPTITNLVVLFVLNGHEQGWLCFTICTVDITWSCMVIHWLTSATEVDMGPLPAYHAGPWVEL